MPSKVYEESLSSQNACDYKPQAKHLPARTSITITHIHSHCNALNAPWPQVRADLAKMGYRSMDEVIGRTDLLRQVSSNRVRDMSSNRMRDL